MDAIRSSLSAQTITQLHEVADLMLEIYKTLGRMEYLNPDSIEKGPHDITALITEYEAREIDNSIIYLYSILPYIGDVVRQDFYEGGEFADFRIVSKLDESRDPFFSGEEEEMMSAWMTPLSFTGGDSACAIIYSAKNHAIWIYEMDDSGCVMVMDTFDNDNIVDGEFEHGIYCNGDDRPAADALRDINKAYKTLESVPGEGHWCTDDWRRDVVRPLYEKHGWLTGDFNREAFLVDQARANARIQVRKFAETVMEKPKFLSRGIAEDDDPKWETLREAINKAPNVKDEWMARWKLLNEQSMNDWSRLDFVKAQKLAETFEHFKQDDQILWEQDWLRHEVQKKKYQLRLAETNGVADWDRKKEALLIFHYKKMTGAYEKAYEATKTESLQLLPNKDINDICGGPVEWSESEEAREADAEMRGEFILRKRESVQKFLQQLPQATEEVAELVKQAIA